MKSSRILAALALVLGTAGILALGILLYGETSRTAPHLALAFVFGFVIIGLFGFGIRILMRESEESEGEVKASYRHALPLVVLILCGLVAALVVRPFLIPPTFGEFGHYRGDAMREARQFTARHVGEETCNECHDDKIEIHDKDAHATVPCETCHGPGWEHADTGDEVELKIPEGRAVCLTCHRRLDARPGDFPQIKVKDHFKKNGIIDMETKCIECHDPHEPLFMDRDLRKARLHPLIQRCRDCHMGEMSKDTELPVQHPAIFQCNYCHEDIATDFAGRTHSKLECDTCHKFFKESVYAGRIIRDTDPRFCLLCHQEAEFKGDTAPPGISWPDHREDMSEGPEDDAKICTDCHRENIHLLRSQIQEQAFKKTMARKR